MNPIPALHPARNASFWFLPLLVVLTLVAVGMGQTKALLPPCPFHLISGLDCPGCGSTRAIRALLQGHFIQAIDFNLLTIPALLMLAIGFSQPYFQPLRSLWLRLNRPGIVLAIVLAFWVLRNLPWPPFLWLSAGH